MGIVDKLFKEQPLGVRGEKAAAKYLRGKGYRILARNLRLKFGEIDLIVEDVKRNWIVVVEVKSGGSEKYRPEVHLNYGKQLKLEALAKKVVLKYGLGDRKIRFDLVAVVWPAGEKKPTRITHYEGAFQCRF